MSAPTSPMPRASPGKSPTSFGRMLLFPTSNGCGSKESETSHNLLAKPSMIGRAFHVDSTCSHMCPLEVSTAAASRIRPPPLALHMLNLVTQPAADSNHDGSSSSPAAAVSKLHSDQLTLDNSKHDNKSPPESRKLGVAAQDGQPKHSGFDSDQMGHTVGATAAKVQLHPVMEPAGCPGMVSGALTFRDMLGGPAPTEGFQTQDAISPRSMDAAGGMTFRHMLCPEDKQKPGHEVPLTNDDSSAHSTNTLQADTSSRKSAHCAHEVDGTALPGVKESMLAPPLTFRDMLQMSPPCMSAKHGAPTSAISSASLIPSPGVSDVSFGSSLYSPGLSCNEAEGIEPMDIRANLCNMDPPEPQAEVVARYETQHGNSMAPHGMNVQGMTMYLAIPIQLLVSEVMMAMESSSMLLCVFWKTNMYHFIHLWNITLLAKARFAFSVAALAACRFSRRPKEWQPLHAWGHGCLVQSQVPAAEAWSCCANRKNGRQPHDQCCKQPAL